MINYITSEIYQRCRYSEMKKIIIDNMDYNYSTLTFIKYLHNMILFYLLNIKEFNESLIYEHIFSFYDSFIEFHGLSERIEIHFEERNRKLYIILYLYNMKEDIILNFNF